MIDCMERETVLNGDENNDNALRRMLIDEPLTLDRITVERAEQLLDYYMRGLDTHETGDQALWSIVNESNKLRLARIALREILTKRIEDNPGTTIRGEQLRAHLDRLMKRVAGNIRKRR